MKKNKLFLVTAFVVSSLSLSAQTEPTEGLEVTATLNENFCLTFVDDSPIQEFYIADISALGFENEQEAKNVFGTKSNNLITYTVDFPNNRVQAQLHLNRLSESRDKTWWSNYLLDTCDLY